MRFRTSPPESADSAKRGADGLATECQPLIRRSAVDRGRAIHGSARCQSRESSCIDIHAAADGCATWKRRFQRSSTTGIAAQERTRRCQRHCGRQLCRRWPEQLRAEQKFVAGNRLTEQPRRHPIGGRRRPIHHECHRLRTTTDRARSVRRAGRTTRTGFPGFTIPRQSWSRPIRRGTIRRGTIRRATIALCPRIASATVSMIRASRLTLMRRSRTSAPMTMTALRRA